MKRFSIDEVYALHTEPGLPVGQFSTASGPLAASAESSDETAFAVGVARCLVGDAKVNDAIEPLMGSEDFTFMLEDRPGNIMLIGNGAGASVHEAHFVFNDNANPYGIAYFKSLVERRFEAHLFSPLWR